MLENSNKNTKIQYLKAIWIKIMTSREEKQSEQKILNQKIRKIKEILDALKLPLRKNATQLLEESPKSTQCIEMV